LHVRSYGMCMDDGGIVEFYTCSEVTSRGLM
jgi:hypothetical protein